MSRVTRIILQFPGGNPNVQAAARALQDAQMLERFCTTLAWCDDTKLAAVFPEGLRRELRRREFPGIERDRIACFPTAEILRLGLTKLGLAQDSSDETSFASPYRVARELDRAVAKRIANGAITADAVYSYELCARHVFEAARQRSMKRFYELPTAYWRFVRDLLETERELQPAWASTIKALSDSPAIRAQKDDELAAANHIVVPSDFVRSTLAAHGQLRASIDVIPYGAPPSAMSVRARNFDDARLRVLYVGLLRQHKGIAYLFAAMHALDGVATLTLIGEKPDEPCPALADELGRHTYLGTLTRPEVLKAMAEHHVLVFPSLCDGFGLVILEAMAQGLPVIATPNCGGPMIIADCSDGFVVPIRSSAAIAERLEELARDRARLAAMSVAAQRKAGEFTWHRYAEALTGLMRAKLAQPN